MNSPKLGKLTIVLTSLLVLPHNSFASIYREQVEKEIQEIRIELTEELKIKTKEEIKNDLLFNQPVAKSDQNEYEIKTQKKELIAKELDHFAERIDFYRDEFEKVLPDQCSSTKDTIISLSEGMHATINNVNDIHINDNDVHKHIIGQARTLILLRQFKTARDMFLLGLENGSTISSSKSINYVHDDCAPKNYKAFLTKLEELYQLNKGLVDLTYGHFSHERLQNIKTTIDEFKEDYKYNQVFLKIGFIELNKLQTAVLVATEVAAHYLTKGLLNGVKIGRYKLFKGLNGRKIMQKKWPRRFIKGTTYAMTYFAMPITATACIESPDCLKVILKNKEEYEYAIIEFTNRNNLLGQDIQAIVDLYEGVYNAKENEIAYRIKMLEEL